MSNTKFSQFPVAGSLSGSEYAPILQGGTNKIVLLSTIVSSLVDLSPYFKKDGTVAMTGHANWGGKNITNFGTLYSSNSNVIVNTTNANNYLQVASGGVVLNSNGEVTVQATALNVTTGSYKASLKSDLAGSDVVHQLPATSGTLALLSDIENYFVGKYTSLASLQAAIPTGADGDYAIVDSGSGSDAQQYIWDADEGWVPGSGSGGVTSIFGRNGVVTAQTGDYSFSQISGTVTNSQLAGNINYSKMDSTTSASVKSFAITGTGGDGYGEFLAQASNTAAPSSTGYRWFANSAGSPAWTKKNGTDTYVRSFASTNTGDRTYTWQDLSYIVAGIDIAQTFTAQQTFAGSATQIASLSILDTTYKSAIDVSSVNNLRIGNGFTTLSVPSTISRGGSLTITCNGLLFNSTAAGFTGVQINTSLGGSTAGDIYSMQVAGTFQKGNISGVNYYAYNAIPTINQTGTTTGDVTIYNANPNIQSVLTGNNIYGFRSQLTASPLGGGTAWNIYADGTALSHFNHTVLIGGTTADSTGTKTLTMSNGTAPGAAVTNAFQLHSSSGRAMIYEDADRYIVQAASSTKITASAPYTNDGYIQVAINGTTVKLMTTA